MEYDGYASSADHSGADYLHFKVFRIDRRSAVRILIMLFPE